MYVVCKSRTHGSLERPTKYKILDTSKLDKQGTGNITGDITKQTDKDKREDKDYIKDH